MALIVQKYGGTSVGSVERIQEVARRVLDTQARGHEVAVVVSAMSGETNRLVGLAHQIDENPYSRDYDLLIASGEQVAVGLVSLAINAEAKRRGLTASQSGGARGLLGHQIGILTDSVFSKARIQQINTQVLFNEIKRKVIPVIAGFQGVDSDNNITTLGRGGSDTSAVAIAIAIKADDCEIYTDVDGVYTTDPRICPNAKKIAKISYEEMMELASVGAKVLQIRSVELAAKYQMPLQVRSSFSLEEGTRVVSQEMLGNAMEQVVVTGVAAEGDQVKLTLRNLTDRPGVAAKVFGALSAANVVVDIIVQDTPSDGKVTLSFTVKKSDQAEARKVLTALKQTHFSELVIAEQEKLAKVSIVGVGMQHHPGVASRFFEILANAEINISLVTTSEIKVSCLVNESDMKRAVVSVHDGFALGQ